MSPLSDYYKHDIVFKFFKWISEINRFSNIMIKVHFNLTKKMKKINKTFQISVQKVVFNYLWVGYIIFFFLKSYGKRVNFNFFSFKNLRINCMRFNMHKIEIYLWRQLVFVAIWTHFFKNLKSFIYLGTPLKLTSLLQLWSQRYSITHACLYNASIVTLEQHDAKFFLKVSSSVSCENTNLRFIILF